MKEERAKNRPRRTKDYKADDLPYTGKDFPYRLRWIGCNVIDLPMQSISVTLEDLGIQTRKLKQLRNFIRLKLNTFTLQDDTIVEAFKVFMWALNSECKDAITVKDEPPCNSIFDIS